MKDGTVLSRRMHVIDDETLINDLLCKVAEAEGYEVRSFRAAEEFLALVDEEMPELLLVDIFRPDFDGFDLLDQLEKRDVLPSVVIMGSKGNSSLGAARTAFADSRIRIVGQIEKPCSVAEIREVIGMERVFADRSELALTYTI